MVCKRAEEKGQKMSETGKEAKIAAIRSSLLSEARQQATPLEEILPASSTPSQVAHTPKCKKLKAES